MAATTWRGASMDTLLHKLQQEYPELQFRRGSRLCWSPHQQIIFYTDSTNALGLLHETSHAILGHSSYITDIDLLRKETAAWEKARELAMRYGLVVDEKHVENCLDTYRDWLHKRSTCSQCRGHGLQATEAMYQCPNCQATWEVSSARFCRPYRRKMPQNA
jgi:rubrerythrin